MYFVYVLQNAEGRPYIGFTSDLDKRARQHQEGEAGWTHTRGPWTLVYHETYTDRSEALRRERNLKRGRTNLELRQRLVRSILPRKDRRFESCLGNAHLHNVGQNDVDHTSYGVKSYRLRASATTGILRVVFFSYSANPG